MGDLARGLIAAFEPEARLVGPLAGDYEYLASVIAGALCGEKDGASVREAADVVNGLPSETS